MTAAGAPEILKLAAGDLVLDLCPALGGSITGLRWHHPAGGWIDLLRPTDTAAIARRDIEGVSCFPLTPYSNRLRNRRFEFEGREIVLPPDASGPHAQHGHGWRRAWQMMTATPDSATLRLTHAADARDARDGRPDDELGQIAQAARVDGAAEVERHDGERRGREALDDDVDPRREGAARLAHARLRELERAPHVGAGREQQRDLDGAADRARANALDAEHRRERHLERPPDRRLRQLGRRVAAARDDDDAREVDLGVDAARHASREQGAAHGEAHGDHPDERAARREPVAHGATSMASPSAMPSTGSTTTV